MDEETYLEKAHRLLQEKVKHDISKKKLLTKDTTEIPYFRVKTVWFSKNLQNWKGLFITDLPDELYYELTYNGDKKETYLDTYEKLSNLVIKDDE